MVVCCLTLVDCVVIIERQNYAKDQIKTYDLSTIDGIVIASGDGLLYEVCTASYYLPLK